MNDDESGDWRYFLSYTSVRLPLKLVTPLNEEEVRNRNTYFSARFDDQERLTLCRKIVYGELEMEHRYDYYPEGGLRRAEITSDGDETRTIEFDSQGAIVSQDG